MKDTPTTTYPDNLRMYTRDDVAAMFGCHKDHVVMLSQTGCLSAIRIGKRYMYSYEAIKQFQHDYAGCDVSNKVKAVEAYHQHKKE
ncbi:helix-turn-helix domain-containing protein [Faecalicoccus pleomorphus]|uniref:helix-turn-helix domain-containing protein n=1 Tax=Faecalicoccus pleomorphus TaxID=1323 RepID=UPI0022E98958|nr:helix-turn-helix domain-containing protein [Faecalicoccus pleomorphus]